jgi:hypothetical protein
MLEGRRSDRRHYSEILSSAPIIIADVNDQTTRQYAPTEISEMLSFSKTCPDEPEIKITINIVFGFTGTRKEVKYGRQSVVSR